MSDVVASALIEIEPDFSSFQRQLEKGLSQAVAKAQKSAASTLKVDVQLEAAAGAAKNMEKSMKGTAGDSEALTKGFTKLNNTLGQIYQSIIVLSEALRGVGRSQDIKVQTDAMAKFLQVVGTVSKVAEAGTTISELTGRFARLAELREKVTGFFKGASDGTAKVKTEATGAKGALQKFGDGFNYLFERIPDVGTTTVTQITEDVKDAAGNIVSSTTKVITANEILEQRNASVLRTLKGVAGGWQESTSKAKETGAIVDKVGEKMVVLASKTGVAGSSSHKLAAASSEVGKQHAAATQKTASLGSIVDILAGKQKKTTEAINQTAEAHRKQTLGIEDATTKIGIFSRIKNFFIQKVQGSTHAVKEFKDGLPAGINGLVSFGGVIRKAQLASQEAGNGITALKEKFTQLQHTGGPLSSAIGLIGSKLMSLGPVGAAAVAVVGIGLVAKAATSMGKAIIAAAGPASQLAESTNAVAVTLGTEGAAAFKKLIPAASELGITQLALNQSITPIVPLLKNAGLAGNELAGRLNSLVRRAVDLGSIFNRTTDDVIPALASALRGETEPAERLGISFNALAVDAKAAALGFSKTGGEFEESAKQIARLELIMEKSTFAANDYNNTITGLANSTRNFRAVTEELSHEFSHVFLKASENITASLNRIATEAGPGLTKFFHTITPLMTDIGQIIADIGMDGVVQSFLDAASAVSTTLAPVMSSLLVALDGFLEVFNVLNVVFGRFIGGVSPAAVALVGLFVFSKIKLMVMGLTSALGHGASGLGRMAASAKLASGGMSKLGTAASFTGAGMTRLGAGISKIAVPLTIITTGIALFQLFSKKAGDSAEELTARVQKLGAEGTTAGEKLGVLFPDEMVHRLKEGAAALQATFDSIVAASGTNLAGVMVSINEGVSDASIAYDNLNKELADGAEGQKAFYEAGKQGLIVQSKEAIALVDSQKLRDLYTKALDRGVKANIDNTLATKANAAALEAATPPAPTDFIEAYKTAKTEFASFLSTALAGATKLKGMDAAIVSSREKIADATKDVNIAQAEYNKILNDTARDARELVEAEEAVIGARERLRDLDQERVDLLEQLKELERPATAEEIAAADDTVASAKERLRDIDQERVSLLEQLKELERPATAEELEGAANNLTRAQIALNKAKEAELELLDKANPKEKISIDLAGLSLDQIKNKIAGLRAAAAAGDRAEKKKSEIPTKDDLTLARLDVVDAENAVTEAEETQEELNNRALENAEEIREINERIVTLDRDKEGIERDINTAVTAREKLNNRALINAKDIREVNEDLVTLGTTQAAAQRTLNDAVFTEGELRKGNTARHADELTALGTLQTAQGVLNGLVVTGRDLERERRDFIAESKLSEDARQAKLIEENATLLTQLNLLDQVKEKQGEILGLSGQSASQLMGAGLGSPDALPGLGGLVQEIKDGLVGVGKSIKDGNATAKQILAAQLLENLYSIQLQALNTTGLGNFLLGPVAKKLGTLEGAIRDMARDFGIPGARVGAILSSNNPTGTLVRAGERGNPEAIFPLRHEAHAMSILRTAFPQMSMGLQAQLAPALQGSSLEALKSPTGYEAPFSPKSTALEIKLDRLIQLQEEGNGRVGISAPISVSSSGDPQLAARKVARELKKLHRRINRG